MSDPAVISAEVYASLAARLRAVKRGELELVKAALGDGVGLSGVLESELRTVNATLQRWELQARRRKNGAR